MAGIFGTVLNAGRAVVERMSAPPDENLVKTVNDSEFADVPTADRHEGLLLHGPKVPNALTGGLRFRSVSASTEVPGTFEIVVHADKLRHYGISVFRTTDEEAAKRRFSLYKRFLPYLVEMDSSSALTTGYLQTTCDEIRRHSDDDSFNLGHLAVLLDLRHVVDQDKFAPFLDVSNGAGMTPLMMAVTTGNAWMSSFLMGKKVRTDHTDNNLNTVYHHAAVTSKEIIEIICKPLEDEITSVKFKPREQESSILPPSVYVLNWKNADGMTPLHLACVNDKPDCVHALIVAGADPNVGATDDEVPLYTAVKSSSTKCVTEILKAYPKQLHMQDVKHGGTPLHWAKSKELIEALLEAGCNAEVKNFKGETALLAMVRYDRFDCVLALLSSGAEVNSKDANGNTALHAAVANSGVSIVRALLVFDADTSLQNNAGQTPWMLALHLMNETGFIDSIGIGQTVKDCRKMVLYSLHAVGASGYLDFPALSKKGDTISFEGLEKEAAQKRSRVLFDDFLGHQIKAAAGASERGGSKRGRGRLLSLDGGGIKGLVLTRMLRSMELVWEKPAIECFDWVIGTSTGGILALSLCSGKSVMESQRLYLQLKDRVFINSKPYDTKSFEALLQQTFGNSKMFDLRRNTTKVMVTGTVADREPPDLHLFRNYEAPQAVLGVPEYSTPGINKGPTVAPRDQLVWKAARASGAAPSFFRPEGCYVDGGILANNPAMDLLTEIAEYNVVMRSVGRPDEAVEPAVLLSLGTGVPPVTPTTVVDIFRPESPRDTLKLMFNIDGMGRLMLESMVDTDTRVMDRVRGWCSMAGIALYRLSPLMATNVELDEKDDKVLVDLMWTTMAYMHSKRDDLLQLKQLLLLPPSNSQ